MNFSQVKLCTAIQTKANMDTAPMAAPMAGFRLWSQSPNATTTDSVHDDHDVTNDVAVSRKDSMVRGGPRKARREMPRCADRHLLVAPRGVGA